MTFPSSSSLQGPLFGRRRQVEEDDLIWLHSWDEFRLEILPAFLQCQSTLLESLSKHPREELGFIGVTRSHSGGLV
jgi:hypothetical protein